MYNSYTQTMHPQQPPQLPNWRTREPTVVPTQHISCFEESLKKAISRQNSTFFTIHKKVASSSHPPTRDSCWPGSGSTRWIHKTPLTIWLFYIILLQHHYNYGLGRSVCRLRGRSSSTQKSAQKSTNPKLRGCVRNRHRNRHNFDLIC
jgi:hypothetical protein